MVISGKDAWDAMWTGDEVEWSFKYGNNIAWELLTNKEWQNWETSRFLDSSNYMFRLKPKYVTIFGRKVEAPFKPNKGETYFFLDSHKECGYSSAVYMGTFADDSYMQFGAWKNKSEIKKIVGLLKTIGD